MFQCSGPTAVISHPFVGIAIVVADILERRFGSMLENVQQRQTEDLSTLAESIRVHMMVEFTEMKAEIALLRSQIVDLQSQIRLLHEQS